MRTRITEILGIKHPVFQGGMAWIADADLAAAVSEAGGLGLISSINGGVEAVRIEIRKARELTSRPFGVNIMLASPDAAAIADLVVEEGVGIVTTGAGSPAPYMEKWKAAGIRVIPVVASVAYAIKMQELGATAVIAEGAESGGHIGDTHTMALLPQILDAVDIPVIAAGGIFDGRAAAAAFIMGAAGVQVGTRFLLARECRVHPVYKERLIKASDIGTMVTGKSLGDAVRALKTPFTKKFAAMEADSSVSDDVIRAFGTGSLRKAVFDGNLAEGSFLAGEVAGLAKRVESAEDIVNDLINGAEALLKAAPEKIYGK
ncbi:MAG: nitronate monooxygenase [Bacteroidales bacterium]|nr:nitronate monooxygenase [Bacteroidales bacterium]